MLLESKSHRIDELIGERLSSGRYESREDVLIEAFQSLADREQTLADLERGLADLERGLADEAGGRVRDAATAFAQLRSKYQIPVKP